MGAWGHPCVGIATGGDLRFIMGGYVAIASFMIYPNGQILRQKLIS